MKVLLPADVFTNPPAYKRALYQILIDVAEGRHRAEVDEAAFEAWLQNQDPGLADDLRTGLRSSARLAREEPANVATVEIVPQGLPDWNDPVARLPLDMAARLLSEPLGLLLENFEHDLDFLKAHLPPGMLANIKKQIDEGWILVLNGGGSVLGDHLRQRAEEPVRRLRTWVMFDSDRLHPDEQEPAWDGRAPNGKDASCQALGWTTTCDSEYHERFWALHRRSIENYLPMSELEVYDSREPDHLDWVGAFARLSDAQRWYFNMKRGLAGDRTDPALSRTRGQYDNLPGPDRALLERGLGRHLSDHYKMAMQRRFAWDDQARDEAKAALADLQRLL